MAEFNLPAPQEGANDKETIQNLMDTVMRLRRELEFVLQNIDLKNAPIIGKEIDNKVNKDTYESQLIQTASEISSKVSKNGVISSINQTPEQIKIQAAKILLEGIVTANQYFKILADGSMEATSGKVGGYDISGDGLVGNRVELKQDEIKFGSAFLRAIPSWMGAVESDMNALVIKGNGFSLEVDSGNPYQNFPIISAVMDGGELISEGTFAYLSPAWNKPSSIGYSDQRYDNIYLTNQPNVSSDIRIKNNIQEIPKDLIEYIREIKPKMYLQNDKWHFGYIAQDVERALYKYSLNKVGFKNARDHIEQYAFLHKDESYMSLLYGEIAVLKEAELTDKIQQLEDRIVLLEKKRGD